MAACQEANAAACTRLFACVPVANRDAAFLAQFGPNVTECKANLNATCANLNATCPVYDSAKAATCTSKISASTCATVLDPNAVFPVECDQICSAATGAGGATGTGGSNLATAAQFCDAFQAVLCDQVFTCVPAAQRDASFVSSFGSTPAECKAMSATTCTTAAADCVTYTPATAPSCIGAFQGATCAQFVDLSTTSPAACTAACPGQF
jgi:hypothetical protein